MWTLVTLSGLYAVGLFPSQVAAEMWALQYLPGMGMKAVELLLQADHHEILRDHDLYTQDNAPIALC